MFDIKRVLFIFFRQKRSSLREASKIQQGQQLSRRTFVFVCLFSISGMVVSKESRKKCSVCMSIEAVQKEEERK